MKLKQWANEQGVSYSVALRWFHAGYIDGAVQLPTGTILVNPPEGHRVRDLTGYARVSSSDQKADLQRQADRLKVAGAKTVVSEVGSALNGKRPGLRKLLRSPDDILVEHRDRLTRFGFEYLEAAIAPRKIIVLDDDELDDDLVRDMTEILTSFCARLYGRRSAKNRAQKAMAAAAEYA